MKKVNVTAGLIKEMVKKSLFWLIGSLVVIMSMLAFRVDADQDENPVPDGVTMLMERGGIPAVFDPVFVSAEDADIPDDAWILGIAIDGEARAYSLNLLNHHEIVNDQLAGIPVAAVW